MTYSEHRKSEFRQEAVTGSTAGQKITTTTTKTQRLKNSFLNAAAAECRVQGGNGNKSEMHRATATRKCTEKAQVKED